MTRTADLVAKGEVGRAMDLLLQRFKALEAASQADSWTYASHLEILPPEENLVADAGELAAAARAANAWAKAHTKPAGKARAKAKAAPKAKA